MARDYYADARALAELLRGEGFDDWAVRLNAAITASFSATEILMALRWQAQQLGAAGLPLSGATQSQLESLLAELDRALA